MMGTNNVVFLEVIEWLDNAGVEIIHRIPESGSGEIKLGAQLIVRESQCAVFFYNGKAYDVFSKGRHTLKTANIPILNKILSIPWAMTSPLRAEVYFVNMKVFPNLKWGTKDPVAFKDSQLGLIRLRAFGIFNLQVIQPVLFINSLIGTQGFYTTDEIRDFLSRVIVSRFNDYLGEKLDTVFSLPGQYESISQGLMERLREDFAHYGIGLQRLYIQSITPPEEVQKAIDDKSRLAVFDDINKLLKLKAAMAIEKISESSGNSGNAFGMGMGFMMPAMFTDLLKDKNTNDETIRCDECNRPVSRDARFCSSCGHQLVIFRQCPSCSKNIPPSARFCPRCGKSVDLKPQNRICSKCNSENIPESIFCNQCGEKI